MSNDVSYQYIKFPIELITKNITHAQFRLYAFILANRVESRQTGEMTCFFGYDKIAASLGTSKGAIIKNIKQLCKLGLLDINAREQNRCNGIRVQFSAIGRLPEIGVERSLNETFHAVERSQEDSKRSQEDSERSLNETLHIDNRFKNLNLKYYKAERSLNETFADSGANNHIATGDVAPFRSMPIDESAKKASAESQCKLEDFLLVESFFEAFPELKGVVDVVKWSYSWGNSYIVRPTYPFAGKNQKIAEKKLEIEKFFAEKKQKITVFSQKTHKNGEIIINCRAKTAS